MPSGTYLITSETWYVFSKSMVASLVATALDFGVLYFLTEFCQVWYVVSTAIGSISGAIAGFTINRYWAFKITEAKIHYQAFKYVLVSAGSLVLNTLGIWAITENSNINYMISRIIVAVTVAIAYNYTLNKLYVFKK